MKEFFKSIVNELYTLEWLFALLALTTATIAGASVAQEFYVSACLWSVTSFLWMKMSKRARIAKQLEKKLDVANAE